MSEVKRVGTSEAAFSIILFRYLVEIVYLLDCIVFTLTYPVHPTAGLSFKLLFPLSSSFLFPPLSQRSPIFACAGRPAGREVRDDEEADKETRGEVFFYFFFNFSFISLF